MPEIDLSLLIYGLAVGLGAGAIAGILAGLAGVGGGLIYMPVFYACMPGTTAGVAIHVFASLVAVVITGFFSARSHWRLQHVDYHMLKILLPGLIAGAGLGLWSTLHLPEAWVLLALATLDGWMAYDYGRNVLVKPAGKTSAALFSGPIGFISGTLGVGGGTMIAPLLRRFVALRIAVGTSAACGLLMALGAILANILFEPGWHYMLAEQSTFLAGAWFGIAVILPKSTAWAAHLHTVVPDHTLRISLKTTFMLLASGLFVAAILSALS
ncbi:MAG: sulfite exporter TauE/SafE family protein [Mariprofundus sp.]|nr:sulfite exporter TauE/SafE family protein [Mariprofundus sp.]